VARKENIPTVGTQDTYSVDDFNVPRKGYGYLWVEKATTIQGKENGGGGPGQRKKKGTEI